MHLICCLRWMRRGWKHSQRHFYDAQLCGWSINAMRKTCHDGRRGDSSCSAMCLRSSVDGVMALGQQIEIVFCFFFPTLDASAHDFWDESDQEKLYSTASPGEGLLQRERRSTEVCMYAPGISMLETTSGSSSMSMMLRWKSLLLSDCR